MFYRLIRFCGNFEEDKIENLEVLLERAKHEYVQLLDGDLHLALFSKRYSIAFYAIDELIDKLKFHETEVHRGHGGTKLANCIQNYKGVMEGFLTELSNQTKFAMLPHINKPSNYKAVITQLNTRLNKLL